MDDNYLSYKSSLDFQDREEDRLIGVKSTALLFGDKTKIILTRCSVACVALLALAGANCALSKTFPSSLQHFEHVPIPIPIKSQTRNSRTQLTVTVYKFVWGCHLALSGVAVYLIDCRLAILC